MKLDNNSENRVNDNELAVISMFAADVTIVNSMRMQYLELYGPLEVIVVELLKLNNSDFKISTIFCNQGINPTQRYALEVEVNKREI